MARGRDGCWRNICFQVDLKPESQLLNFEHSLLSEIPMGQLSQFRPGAAEMPLQILSFITAVHRGQLPRETLLPLEEADRPQRAILVEADREGGFWAFPEEDGDRGVLRA